MSILPQENRGVHAFFLFLLNGLNQCYCSLASQRTVTRPVIPDRLWRWTGRIQAGILSLRAGQQVTGTGLNSNKSVAFHEQILYDESNQCR